MQRLKVAEAPRDGPLAGRVCDADLVEYHVLAALRAQLRSHHLCEGTQEDATSGAAQRKCLPLLPGAPQCCRSEIIRLLVSWGILAWSVVLPRRW